MLDLSDERQLRPNKYVFAERTCLPDTEEFIETQANFQFGRCEAPLGADIESLAAREASSRPSFVFHNTQNGTFVPADRGLGLTEQAGRWSVDFGDEEVGTFGSLKAGRKADVLSDLFGLGLRVPLLLDMNDAARWPNVFPVFQYNRLSGAKNSILWPLRRVHKIGAQGFVTLPPSGEPTLRQKEPRLFWRGSLRGFSHGNTARNISGPIKRHLAGRVSREDLLQLLATVSRYIFVSRYFDREGFDIGFSPQHDKPHHADVAEIRRLTKEHVSPSDQLAYRYLISIGGTDVASSFGWQLSTNSIVLRETYAYEVFFDCHFRPWEHYIPILPDFSDVVQKIEWCESHLEDCQQMIDRRHKVIPLLLNEEVRREAFRRVVERYNEFYLAGSYLPRPNPS